MSPGERRAETRVVRAQEEWGALFGKRITPGDEFVIMSLIVKHLIILRDPS